jgi:His-Xaa-Ser system protein HxsD
VSTNSSTSILQWVELGDGCLRLTIDTQLYPETSIFRTCYLFTDRAYLYLRTEKPNEIIVEFRSKKSGDRELNSVVGEFGNELLNQRIRLELATETRSIREMIVAQAFSEADFDEHN